MRSSQVRRGNRLVTAVTVLRHPRRALRRTVRRKVTVPLKRRVRREIRRRPLFRCGACGKPYNSPLGHVCNVSDFGKRRRAAQRARVAAERKAKRAAERARVNERVAAARRKERQRASERVRRERQRAAARVKAARAKARPARKTGRPAHDYTRCRDHDCQRQACEAYREGVADGMDASA